MKKYKIILLLIVVICFMRFVFVPVVSEILVQILIPSIDQMINSEINNQASDLMRDEIIKQLQEKGAIK